MKISITKIENEVCSCNSCNAANYDTPFKNKKTDDLYLLRIGNTAITMCGDCLKALSGMVDNAVMLQKLNAEFNNRVELSHFVPTTEEREFGGMEEGEVFTIGNVIVANPALGYDFCREAISEYINKEN